MFIYKLYIFVSMNKRGAQFVLFYEKPEASTTSVSDLAGDQFFGLFVPQPLKDKRCHPTVCYHLVNKHGKLGKSTILFDDFLIKNGYFQLFHLCFYMFRVMPAAEISKTFSMFQGQAAPPR